MSLFNINGEYYSHPDYPYNKHINNIADSFNDSDHRITAKFHDLGKLGSLFQRYINPNNSSKKKTTHALESAFVFLKENGYELNNNTFPIFLSILKHHGNLDNINELAYDLSDSEEIIYKHPNLLEMIREIEIAAKLDNDFDLERCCDFFFEEPFVDYYKLKGIESYYKIKETFSKLIFADKYEAIFKAVYKKTPFLKIENYIDKLLHFISQKQNKLSSIRNESRISIIKKFQNNPDKKIFIIEAPTGIGKTFMALQLALEICKKKSKERIITALPMTTIIDQTYTEYLNIVDSNILMKYHHLSYSKQYLNSDQGKYDEEVFYKQKNYFIHNSWAQDSIIITTFNQVLNLFYSNKNSDLIKFWTLRNSVVIFDEIQAVPRVLLHDFTKSINYLAKIFNIDFILMSATVPDIKNFLDDSLMIELLDNKYFSLEFNNRYELSIDKTIDTEKKLIEEVKKKYNDNNSVLAVVNTKKLALDIYKELKNKLNECDKLFLLSSLFIPKHRNEIIFRIKNLLKMGDKIILISTQVIEAGVDLDFDIGFREFSPFYSIIQTAGRINRENRDTVKQIAELIVIPRIGYSPYHPTDVLHDEVCDLIQDKVRENQLLPLLQEYFQIAIKRTSTDGLLENKINNLEFKNVALTFNEYFMKKLPYLTPVFIEYEKNLYNSFYSKLNEYNNSLKKNNISLENKMEIKSNINELFKKIAQYIINVGENDTASLPPFSNNSDIKVCQYELLENYYSSKHGWKGENSLLLF